MTKAAIVLNTVAAGSWMISGMLTGSPFHVGLAIGHAVLAILMVGIG